MLNPVESKISAQIITKVPRISVLSISIHNHLNICMNIDGLTFQRGKPPLNLLVDLISLCRVLMVKLYI